jgi:hypothetical protein
MSSRCIRLVAVATALLLIGHSSSNSPPLPAGGPFSHNIPSDQTQRARTISAESRPVFSQEQASLLAQNWVTRRSDQIPEWKDAQVGSPTIYSDLNGWPSAFVFSVFQDRKDVGYVILTYEAQDHPVVEFSTNPAPHLRCDDNCRRTAARQGFTLITMRPIFLGPLNYYFEAVRPSLTREQAKRWLMTAGGESMVAIEHRSHAVPPQETPAKTVSINVRTLDSEAAIKIPSVPDYNQFFGPSLGYDFDCYAGCTPTAATNLAHYWAQAGYPNLYDAYWPDTTVDLRKQMETFCFGNSGTTWNHKTAPGLNSFAQARGYSFESLQYCWPTSMNWVGCDQREFTWQRYADEIDQCRPALISISNHPLYGNHTVTGIGYDTASGNYYIVHDNWASTPREVWILHDESEDRYRFLFPFIPSQMDHTPPINVTVSPMPPYQADTKFNVSWNGTDEFPGIGSFDVQYSDGADGEWQWWLRATTQTSAQLNDHLDLKGGHTYFVRVRARDKHCNVSDWSTPAWSAADAEPPTTTVFTQPRYRTAKPFDVAWGGSDDAAGIASYDIWTKSEGEEWELWQQDTTATLAVYSSTQVGGTYYFTSLGTDRLGRQEIKDPDAPDTRVTIARHSISGRALGNRGQPVLQAQVSSPNAYEPVTVKPNGQYALFFPTSQEITITVRGRAIHGILPPMKGIALTHTITELSGVDLVLPPSDNVIRNSHFEEPDLALAWTLNGVITPALTSQAYTGDHAVTLGLVPDTLQYGTTSGKATTGGGARQWSWTISQTVTLSPTVTNPTLSWLYAISGTVKTTDTLTVSIRGPGDPTAFTIPLSDTGWTHAWRALDEKIIGHPVTVSFEMRRPPTSDPLVILIDEVTLGSGDDGPSSLFLPLIYH